LWSASLVKGIRALSADQRAAVARIARDNNGGKIPKSLSIGSAFDPFDEELNRPDEFTVRGTSRMKNEGRSGSLRAWATLERDRMLEQLSNAGSVAFRAANDLKERKAGAEKLLEAAAAQQQQCLEEFENLMATVVAESQNELPDWFIPRGEDPPEGGEPVSRERFDINMIAINAKATQAIIRGVIGVRATTPVIAVNQTIAARGFQLQRFTRNRDRRVASAQRQADIAGATMAADSARAAGDDIVASAGKVLANADYHCVLHAGNGSGRFADEGFRLTDGKFIGPREPPDSHDVPEAVLDEGHVAVGDLDGDGKIDAVAPVYDGGAGTGVFWTIHVFSDAFGTPRCTHAIFLGDRIELQSVEIQPPDSIVVDMKDHGPDEGMAQRTMQVRRKFQLSSDNVTAYQQLPGKMWTAYRPELWSVSGSAQAPTTAPVATEGKNPLGAGKAADAIWQIVKLSAAGDVRSVADHERALEIVPKPARGDRSRARSLNDQGLAQIRAGKYAEATKTFRDGVAADPAEPEVLNNLAYARLLAEDYQGAAEAIVSTLAVAPTRPMAWETLGQVLVALGEPDAAVGAFRMNVRVSKDSEKAEKRLQKLAGTVPNPAVAQAIRTALAGGTVVASGSESAGPSPEPSRVRFSVAQVPSGGGVGGSGTSEVPDHGAGEPSRHESGRDPFRRGNRGLLTFQRDGEPHGCTALQPLPSDKPPGTRIANGFRATMLTKDNRASRSIEFISQPVDTVMYYTNGCVCPAALLQWLDGAELCQAVGPPYSDDFRRCMKPINFEFVRHHNLPPIVVDVYRP